MITNRSVPADTVLPHISYKDVAEASAWLNKAFGFREHFRYGVPEAPNGIQMNLSKAWIMLRKTREGSGTPAELGSQTQSVTVFVEDVDAHFTRAKAAGARIVEELHETEYGERQYGVEDLAGHHWLFARHARDVNPTDWGATVTDATLVPGRTDGALHDRYIANLRNPPIGELLELLGQPSLVDRELYIFDAKDGVELLLETDSEGRVVGMKCK